MRARAIVVEREQHGMGVGDGSCCEPEGVIMNWAVPASSGHGGYGLYVWGSYAARWNS